MRFAGIILIALASGSSYAQTANGQPAFEVASITPSPPQDPTKPMFFGSHGGPGTDDPALFTCERCNLVGLISDAYDMPEYRVFNGDSLRRGQFQLRAKIPEGTSAEQFRLMLQNLLADRFKLAVHRDKKEMQMYTLVVAKGGPKFKASVEGHPRPPAPANHVAGTVWWPARRVTMEELARSLAVNTQSPVADATGLTGTYDFEFMYSFNTLDDPDAGPGMFTALESQLGLKLEPKKGPVEVLVIDHAEKVPTGN